jgi:NADPH:quinone reductase-like Zn-dependent oxidoreductase
MRQVWISRSGPPKVLEVRETADPAPGPGEVTVAVRAAGINFADILARQGLYPDSPPLPCVVGYEAAGTVAAVGDGVPDLRPGQPVIALTRFGGYSSMVKVKAPQVLPKPEALSFEQAAAIPVNYLTAWPLLAVMGGLQAGESVLIHNAGGGVGLAAIDVARKLGAVTYGTASASKHAFLRSRGLDHAIDYRSGDWLTALKDLTGGRGVELVIDPIGGQHWRRSYRALRGTGRLGMFGISAASGSGLLGKLRMFRVAMRMPWFHPARLISGNKGVFGFNLGHLWNEQEKTAAWMRTILRGVEEGWVRPHVDRSFPFDQAAAAHQHMEDRKNVGKVVLVP